MKPAPAVPAIAKPARRPWGFIISPEGEPDVAPVARRLGIRLAIDDRAQPNTCIWYWNAWHFLDATRDLRRP